MAETERKTEQAEPKRQEHTETHTPTQTQTQPQTQTQTQTQTETHANEETQVRERTGLNKFSLAIALLASTNSVLLGYDIGVMSGAILYIKDYFQISSAQQEVLVGSLNIMSLIGSLASGRTSDVIGRRYTIVLAAATFLVGALVMGLAPSYALLMVGRMFAGIGVGYALMIAPLYAAEIAPASARGLLSSLPEVFITFGILIGYILNYVLSGLPVNYNWRVMLGVAAIPAAGIIMGVLFMPESPRWLVMKGRIDEAKKVLLKTAGNEEEAELRLAEMTQITANSDNFTGKGLWKELLLKPTPAVRRILLTSIAINFFMQASGNDAVIYYTPQVFKSAGIHKQKELVLVTVIMGLAKTTFVLFSAMFLDRFGRRPLLLTGTVGMTVSLLALGFGSRYLANSVHKPMWAIAICVVAVCADVSFFSIGLGPITWVYSCEIFPMKLRAQGQAIGVSVNRLVSGAVSMSFLSVSEKITFAGTFFVLGGITGIGTIFFYFCLPETKGKNLEEIEKLFVKKEQNLET